MALGKAGFALGVRPVASLRPHEDVIPSHVGQLAVEMTRDGVQKDPIIIDQESAAVLDGMHRLAAFRKLGIENAICSSVDYSSPSVSLGRWARVYVIKGGSPGLAAERIEGARRVRLAEAFSALERREAGVALLTGEVAFVSNGETSMDDVVATMLAVDHLAEQNGWERTFVAEDEVDFPLQDPKKIVVLPRRLTKEDVVTAARSGRLLPCKTSMHVIDPRPVAVNFPMGELSKATGASLRERMNGREGRLLPPGSMYGGRRYKERLVMLDGR